MRFGRIVYHSRAKLNNVLFQSFNTVKINPEISIWSFGRLGWWNTLQAVQVNFQQAVYLFRKFH
jgi:hypothetical protein